MRNEMRVVASGLHAVGWNYMQWEESPWEFNTTMMRGEWQLQICNWRYTITQYRGYGYEESWAYSDVDWA